MKLVTVTAFSADTMPDNIMREALREISIALMDHGKVTIETGTRESAAILKAWKEPR